MMQKAVVVGGGIMGLFAAVELSQRSSFEVTVLERKTPGAGSSSLSVGSTTRQYADPVQVELRVRSFERFREMEERGLNFRHIGFLRLARTEAGVEQFREGQAALAEFGVHNTEILSAQQIEERFPYIIRDTFVGGQYNPEDGYIDGLEALGLLTAQLRELGGRVVNNAALLGAAKGTSHRFLLETTAGQFDADIVINAAGPWSGQVGELLEAPIDIVNERHEAVVLQLPGGFDQSSPVPMTMDYVVGSAPGVYWRQEGSDQLIAGLHSNHILGENVVQPDDWDPKVSDEAVEQIWAALDEDLPGLELGFRSAWAGLYPHAASGDFLIGPHPARDGVFVGSGLGGVGLHTAPELAAVLVDRILGVERGPRSYADRWYL